MWAIYALTAALLTSFLPIINKRVLRHAPVALVAWAPNALSLPLLLAITLALRGWPQVDWLFFASILASGLLNFIATLASTAALKRADASIATPLLSFNPAFTLLVSAFTLGERPDLRGLLGVLTIVLGIYLFQIERVHEGLLAPLQGLVRQPGVLLAIGASFVWGLTPIVEKVASSIPLLRILSRWPLPQLCSRFCCSFRRCGGTQATSRASCDSTSGGFWRPG